MKIVNDLVEDEKKWFAIYTKYKCEKFVRDQLTKRNIESYVPLLTKTKVYTSRVKEFEVPLVNCYVFVKIDKSQYVHVLRTEYVLKFIKVGQNLISIPEKEIDLLKRVVGQYEVSLGDMSNLELGGRVEVIGGELTGLKGQLLGVKNKNEFVVELTSIGIQLQIQIDKSLLRAV